MVDLRQTPLEPLRAVAFRSWKRLTGYVPAEVLALAFLLVSAFYLGVNAWEWTAQNVVHSAFRVLFAVSFVILVLSFRSRLLTGSLWVLLVISFVVNRVHYDLFGTRVTMGGFYSMLDTDRREAAEFMSLVPWWSMFVVVLFAAIAAVALRRSHARGASRAFAAPVWLALLVIPWGAALQRESIRTDLMHNPVPVIYSVYKGVPLLGDALLTAAYYHEKQGLDDLVRTVRPGFLGDLDAAAAPELVTLVIGESSSRHHYSLYGYQVETTPYLDGLSHDPGFVHLENVVAPSPLTRESLKRALTFATVDDESAYRRYWNVVNLAREAGYYTVWISNQAAVGSDDTVVGAIAHLADEQSFISQEIGGDKLDLVLAERYEELLARTQGRKLFVVLHMIGSHYQYSTRSDDTDKAYIARTGSRVPDYDATIYHTDRTLGRLVDAARADERSAALLFFSDHGEEVEGGAHGLPQLTKVQVDIPLVVWAESGDRADRIVENLRRNHTQLYSIEDAVFLVADLLGWGFTDHQDRLVSSDRFRARVPRILNVNGEITPYRHNLPTSVSGLYDEPPVRLAAETAEPGPDTPR